MKQMMSLSTQTLAQLSVVWTHAEAFCFGYCRTNISHTGGDFSHLRASSSFKGRIRSLTCGHIQPWQEMERKKKGETIKVWVI